MNFYQGKDIYRYNKNVLDICCGTVQLALKFLKNNYHVTDIDFSPYMISYARENTKEYEKKDLDKNNNPEKEDRFFKVLVYIINLEKKKLLKGKLYAI